MAAGRVAEQLEPEFPRKSDSHREEREQSGERLREEALRPGPEVSGGKREGVAELANVAALSDSDLQTRVDAIKLKSNVELNSSTDSTEPPTLKFSKKSAGKPANLQEKLVVAAAALRENRSELPNGVLVAHNDGDRIFVGPKSDLVGIYNDYQTMDQMRKELVQKGEIGSKELKLSSSLDGDRIEFNGKTPMTAIKFALNSAAKCKSAVWLTFNGIDCGRLPVIGEPGKDIPGSMLKETAKRIKTELDEAKKAGDTSIKSRKPAALAAVPAEEKTEAAPQAEKTEPAPQVESTEPALQVEPIKPAPRVEPTELAQTELAPQAEQPEPAPQAERTVPAETAETKVISSTPYKVSVPDDPSLKVASLEFPESENPSLQERLTIAAAELKVNHKDMEGIFVPSGDDKLLVDRDLSESKRMQDYLALDAKRTELIKSGMLADHDLKIEQIPSLTYLTYSGAAKNEQQLSDILGAFNESREGIRLKMEVAPPQEKKMEPAEEGGSKNLDVMTHGGRPLLTHQTIGDPAFEPEASARKSRSKPTFEVTDISGTRGIVFKDTKAPAGAIDTAFSDARKNGESHLSVNDIYLGKIDNNSDAKVLKNQYTQMKAELKSFRDALGYTPVRMPDGTVKMEFSGTSKISPLDRPRVVERAGALEAKAANSDVTAELAGNSAGNTRRYTFKPPSPEQTTVPKMPVGEKDFEAARMRVLDTPPTPPIEELFIPKEAEKPAAAPPSPASKDLSPADIAASIAAGSIREREKPSYTEARSQAEKEAEARSPKTIRSRLGAFFYPLMVLIQRSTQYNPRY